MRAVWIIAATCLATLSCVSQPEPWQPDGAGTASFVHWALALGGTDVEAAWGVAVDDDSIIYVAGFTASKKFDIGTGSPPVIGGADAVIAKLDPDGNALWSRRLGGVLDDTAMSIAIGNGVYFAGDSQSTVIEHDDISATTVGSGDVIVGRLTLEGELLWLRSFGGSKTETPLATITDVAGSAYVAGLYESVDFAAGEAGQLPDPVMRGGFLLKVGADGSVIWARAQSGGSVDESFGIAVDSDQNVYVAGTYMSGDLDAGETGNPLPYEGDHDVLIAKYGSGGNFLWARGFGGDGWDSAYGVVTTSADNIIVAGMFSSEELKFDDKSVHHKGPEGTADLFLASLHSSGDTLWAASWGGDGLEVPWALALDKEQNIYVAGETGDPGFEFAGQALGGAGEADAFVFKLDSAGEEVWARSFGGPSMEIVRGMAVDKKGNVLLAGEFQSGTAAVGDSSLENHGILDMFLVKLGQ